jgi:hypothetical protein
MNHPPTPLDLRRLPRDLRQLGRLARRAGWFIEATRSQHWRWISPAGAVVICSGSPSDTNNAVIIRRQLRRLGLHV